MKWMVVALLVIVTPSLFGQLDPEPAVPDSVLSPEPVIPTGVVASQIDTVTKYHPTKSAGLAMLFSAIVPGAGQAYNESYLKVPVVVGLGVLFVSSWLHNNRLYHDYRNQYSASITTVVPGGDGNKLTLREFYRDQRDTYAWYFAILYFLNVADAYVDASLYDFNVGDDLSIRFMPEPRTRLAVRITF